MRIAPLKWTYESKEIEDEENKITYYTIYAINQKYATQFTLVDVEEYFAKQVVEKLNDAMETQRHEFLWGLANMHNQGTLYGDDEE